jgi:hypothetical protein
MAKLLSLFALIALAVLIGSLFGALHNQVSYTISPEYFHNFKFNQFRIEPPLENRLGAALVGIKASWWMGLVIGVIPFLLGARRQPSAIAFRQKGIRAISAVVGLATLCALFGALCGPRLLSPQAAKLFYIPTDVTNPADFMNAGLMHDASYLGGLLGLLGASVIMIRR